MKKLLFIIFCLLYAGRAYGATVTISSAAAGGGDAITVNSVGADTTANIKDSTDITWTLTDGGAGGPDDVAGAVTNDSHAHTATTISGLGTDDISGLDISADTNLTAGDALTLTDDNIDFDGGASPAGELGGTWASPTIDATHSGSAHHAAVTLGASNHASLALSTQELTLTVARDIVAGVGLSGGDDNVLPGADADTTLTFAPSEVTGGTTWDDGGEASVAWTWNLSAGDPTITFGNDLITLSNSLTVATGKNITLGVTQWNSGDSIDGEIIANDTIDDDSIDFADVTGADLTLTDCVNVYASNTASGATVMATNATVYEDLSVGVDITVRSTQWNVINQIDGEQIADDTIDDDSIDFTDITGADLTLTDCTNITASGTASAPTVIATDATIYEDLTVNYGLVDFGTAISLEVPNGANPTTDAAGEVAVDSSATSGSMLRFYGDAAYALPAYQSKSFVITNPTSSADGSIWRVPYAITIKAVHLLCKGNVVVGHLTEQDANGLNDAGVDGATDITGVVNTNVNDDGTLSNPSIDAGDYTGWRTTSVTGTPTYAIITIDYIVDQVN